MSISRKQLRKMEEEEDESYLDLPTPTLPNHLVSEKEYYKYCRDLCEYNYKAYGAMVTMLSYADYAKKYDNFIDTKIYKKHK